MGANERHGLHQPAQKSMNTMPSLSTFSAKLAEFRSVVCIGVSVSRAEGASPLTLPRVYAPGHGIAADLFSPVQQLQEGAAFSARVLRVQRLDLQSQAYRAHVLFTAVLRGACADGAPPRSLGRADDRTHARAVR